MGLYLNTVLKSKESSAARDCQFIVKHCRHGLLRLVVYGQRDNPHSSEKYTIVPGKNEQYQSRRKRSEVPKSILYRMLPEECCSKAHIWWLECGLTEMESPACCLTRRRFASSVQPPTEFFLNFRKIMTISKAKITQ